MSRSGRSAPAARAHDGDSTIPTHIASISADDTYFRDGMVAEFERFGMPRFRLLTGVLELLGALGLVAGQFIDALVPLSAGGLALLMALGIVTRIRARDPLLEALPAGALMLLNAFVAVHAVRLGSSRTIG